MSTIGTRRLRAELSDFVRRAGEGERFVVTIDRRAVAQLGPIDAAGSWSTLEDAVAAGFVRRPVIEEEAHSEGLSGTSVEAFAADVRVDRVLRQVRG